jgi:hypothetical protein
VILPGGETVKLKLEQDAPGRYRGRFRAVDAGTYVASTRLTPTYQGGDGAGETVVAARTKAPPAEYAALDVDRQSLTRLARSAGGEYIAADEWTKGKDDIARLAANLARPSGKVVTVKESLWPAFLWTALGLFLLDLVTRRVDLRPVIRRTPRIGTGGKA